ncbi:MAG: DUF3857 domain-containing protein, partial [Chitinophagales bacterium]
MKRYLILAINCIWVHLLFGQTLDVGWGEISEDELLMHSSPIDSGAAAVILLNYGRFYYDLDADPVLYRHVKVKIFDAAAYDLSNIKIDYLYSATQKEITNIKAASYNFDGGKKLIETKLENKMIFDEDVDGYRRQKKFSVPAVKEGTVFEYQYQIKLRGKAFNPEFYFQDVYPIKASILEASIPTVLNYVYVTQLNSLNIEHTESASGLNMGANDGFISQREHVWSCYDVPALKMEKFISGYEDYIAKIDLQLSFIHEIGESPEYIIKDWADF